MKIRKMTQDDVPYVYNLDCEVCEVPWSEKTFFDCVAVGYSCFVVEENEKILGFFIASIKNDIVNLLNIAVAKESQGKGIASLMIQYLIKYMKEKGAKEVHLEVRKSNQAAINLYEKFGFVKVGIRKDYYNVDKEKKEKEDAVLFTLFLSKDE